MTEYEDVLRKAIERWNVQGLDGYLLLYGQKIDVKEFPGVYTGNEGSKNFYQAFWLSFLNLKYLLKILLGKTAKLLADFIFLEIIKEL